jgi:hypothetical protein
METVIAGLVGLWTRRLFGLGRSYKQIEPRTYSSNLYITLTQPLSRPLQRTYGRPSYLLPLPLSIIALLP